MAWKWEPNSALMVPSASDDDVEKAAAWLTGRMFGLTVTNDNTAGLVAESSPVGGGVEDSLEETATFLHIAANITTLDAKRLVNFQNLQFSIIKLCDSWNLMLTSYKIGANDILEKLHVAYLKLLEGFPDLAQQDMEVVSKQVNGMVLAAEKAQRTFSEAKQKMKVGYEDLQCSVEEKELLSQFQRMESDVKQELKRNYFACGGKERRSEATEKFLSELDELCYNHQRNENSSVAKESLGLALRKIEQAEVPLREAENLARTWHVECCNVVKQTLKENVAETTKMTAENRRKFWEKLPFIQQAFDFLCRWKALYNLCSSHLTKVRHVRQKADSFYLENLLPREAVEKAWRMVAESQDLNHIKRFPVVAKRDRSLALGDQKYSLDHLLEVQTIDEAVTSNVKENTFGADSYTNILARVRELGRYLDVIVYLLPEVPTELTKICNSFKTMCRLIVDIFDAFENEAVDLLLSLHIACNCWSRGLHSFVGKELQTPLLVFEAIQALANAVSFLDPSIAEALSKQLGNVRKGVNSTGEADDTITRPWVNTFWRSCFNRFSHELGDRKRLDMALKVVKMIKDCLPLSDVVTEYIAVGREAVGSIGMLVPLRTTISDIVTDEVTSNDWTYDVIKSYRWIQSFRVLCKDELTGVNWFRDQQKMTQSKKTWNDCVQAIKQLGDKLLTELVEEVEARVENDCMGGSWERQDTSEKPVVNDLYGDFDSQATPTNRKATVENLVWGSRG